MVVKPYDKILDAEFLLVPTILRTKSAIRKTYIQIFYKRFLLIGNSFDARLSQHHARNNSKGESA